MQLLKGLKSLFGGGSSSPKASSRQTFPIFVQDHRCGEPVRGEVNLLNELSSGDEEAAFYCRKVLHTSGKHRCFSQMEVQVWFDSKKNLVRHQVSGGKWLSAEEYAAALERFNAPPTEDEPDKAESQIERG